MKPRNITFDLMRGIALILMMLCHLVDVPNGIQRFIYSFHIPLFFIISGYFAKNIEKEQSFRVYTLKNVKRLIIPYVVTMLMLCAWGLIQTIAKQDSSCLIRHLLTLLLSTSYEWYSEWGLINVGPMWFLIALFWTREIFYGLQYAFQNLKNHKDECVLGVSVILSIISTIIHNYIPQIPYCLLQGVTALPFYTIGWYVHRHPQPWWVYGLCVSIWPLAFIYGFIGLYSCTIKIYPLSFLGACGGTYVIYLLCKGWTSILQLVYNKFPTLHIVSPLSWCGLYSLPILCMHTFELHSDIFWSLMCRMPVCGEHIWGGGLAILLAYIIIKIPILKDVYT